MAFQRRTAPAAFLILLLTVVSSCGEDNRDYFYSVSVFNNTDSAITVRYDYDVTFVTYEWQGTAVIEPGNHGIIEWSSANEGGEQIDVEYLGKKRLYTVPQVGSLTVEVQDFN